MDFLKKLRKCKYLEAIDLWIRETNYFIKMINLTFKSKPINFSSTLNRFRGGRDEKVSSNNVSYDGEFSFCIYI